MPPTGPGHMGYSPVLSLTSMGPRVESLNLSPLSHLSNDEDHHYLLHKVVGRVRQHWGLDTHRQTSVKGRTEFCSLPGTWSPLQPLMSATRVGRPHTICNKADVRGLAGHGLSTPRGTLWKWGWCTSQGPSLTGRQTGIHHGKMQTRSFPLERLTRSQMTSSS